MILKVFLMKKEQPKMILYSFASAKFKKNDKIDFINQYVAIYLLPSKLKTGRDQSLGRPK